MKLEVVADAWQTSPELKDLEIHPIEPIAAQHPIIERHITNGNPPVTCVISSPHRHQLFVLPFLLPFSARHVTQVERLSLD